MKVFLSKENGSRQTRGNLGDVKLILLFLALGWVHFSPWALVFCVGLSWGDEQDGDMLTPPLPPPLPMQSRDGASPAG